mmetsp:Transcript_11409/g.25147  ORF Transcript_11409/g.25147 Transcript_11409/m.25147 type:complete len:249 (+) Transcript_11409:97-843(+)
MRGSHAVPSHRQHLEEHDWPRSAELASCCQGNRLAASMCRNSCTRLALCKRRSVCRRSQQKVELHRSEGWPHRNHRPDTGPGRLGHHADIIKSLRDRPWQLRWGRPRAVWPSWTGFVHILHLGLPIGDRHCLRCRHHPFHPRYLRAHRVGRGRFFTFMDPAVGTLVGAFGGVAAAIAPGGCRHLLHRTFDIFARFRGASSGERAPHGGGDLRPTLRDDPMGRPRPRLGELVWHLGLRIRGFPHRCRCQ